MYVGVVWRRSLGSAILGTEFEAVFRAERSGRDILEGLPDGNKVPGSCKTIATLPPKSCATAQALPRISGSEKADLSQGQLPI